MVDPTLNTAKTDAEAFLTKQEGWAKRNWMGLVIGFVIGLVLGHFV
jgi:galactitol-specific phosphotransferase system IIC component